jgi:lipopolysaccharide/colanic/teichoic acid biosynthesis glycosyltransferase
MSARIRDRAEAPAGSRRTGPIASLLAWRRQPLDAPRVPRAKRAMDLLLASALLLCTAPILLGAIVLIRATSPGPAIFRQVRVGWRGRPFVMLKLRTMRIDGDDARFREYNAAELAGAASPDAEGLYRLPDDTRVTSVGRVLRRLSIDELPQLVNVLRGEMSLVGPRPSLPWEVALLTAEQRRRLDCLPGLTGLWQVSGRNRLSMRQMIELDLDYVARRTLALDLKILLRTPRAVCLDRNTS